MSRSINIIKKQDRIIKFDISQLNSQIQLKLKYKIENYIELNKIIYDVLYAAITSLQQVF
jgi:heme-binding NEAT domain protein